jgi:hypothetical protein
MPPLNFWLSASRQINYLFNPIQHTLTTLTGHHFNIRPIPSATHSVFGLAGQISRPTLNPFLPAFQDPNYRIPLTNHPPSMFPILGFDGQAKPIA